MLTIRKEQLAIFEKVAANDFESRMLAHLQQFFSAQIEQLGEPAVRDLIRYGVQRSAAYRVDHQPDVCKYINLMVVFGRDFDRDAKLPWASAILQDQTILDPSLRMTKL